MAVVPRAPSRPYSSTSVPFDARTSTVEAIYWASTHGTYLYYASAGLVLLVVSGLLAVYFYKGPAESPQARRRRSVAREHGHHAVD